MTSEIPLGCNPLNYAILSGGVEISGNRAPHFSLVAKIKMAPKKFVRAVNFSLNEEHRLLDLVENQTNIIENKKTDAVTWREKDEAWIALAGRFNAGVLTSRTVKELRSKYDCLKKAAKKESARIVQSLRGTGGGPPHKPARNVAVLERVLQIVPLSAVGMPSTVDSDALQPARASSPESQCSSTCDEPDHSGLEDDYNMEEMQELQVTEFDELGCSGMVVLAKAQNPRNASKAVTAKSGGPISDHSPMGDESEPGCSGVADTAEGRSETIKWDHYSPAMLQMPKHPALMVSNTPKASSTITKLNASASALLSKNVTNRSRRRPVIAQKETVFSASTSKFAKLAATKTELAKLQMQLLSNEHDRTQKRLDEHHVLDIKLKEADLELKKTKLETKRAKLLILNETIKQNTQI